MIDVNGQLMNGVVDADGFSRVAEGLLSEVLNGDADAAAHIAALHDALRYQKSAGADEEELAKMREAVAAFDEVTSA